MAKNRTITIDDINPESVPENMESFIIMLPVGQSGATETGRTAQTTTIQGDRTQKDRGIEFDYPKSIGAATP
jgi:hypothetical protein